MVCLAGTTWAWFTANISTPPQNIATANYKIDVIVDGETVTAEKQLIANTEYKIVLAASGTADKYGGYCIVKGGEKSLYSEQLLPGNMLSFKFIPSATADYTFTAVWGSYSDKPDITNGCTIGQKAAVQDDPQVSEPQQDNTGRKDVHIVQAEDSLWKIARQYGTTVEKIAAYNDIAQDTVLQIGQEIKIPPQDYEIPAVSSSSSMLLEESSPIPEKTTKSLEDKSAETSSVSE